MGPTEKTKELATTRIFLGGRSAELKDFYLGYYVYVNGAFSFRRTPVTLEHPWRENKRSLIFLGDYEREYVGELKMIPQKRYPHAIERGPRVKFDFDYEPLEALCALLRRPNPEQTRTAIGGAPQLMKVYRYGNSLPFVIRTAPDQHYLLGRRLFSWEKTEYPILDLSLDPPKLLYPMLRIPLPTALEHDEYENDKVTDGEPNDLVDG